MSVRLMLLLPLFFMVLPAGADSVPDLYAARIPVVDQSAATRSVALKDAMREVLVKLTGSRAVLESDAATVLAGNPDRFLQQYRYVPLEAPPADADAPRLALYAEFDGRALEQNLRRAGVPLWGRERPLTLVFVARDEHGRELLSQNGDHAEVAALARAAQRRGLPMRLPEMDPEDATRVSFMDVWGVFEEPLQSAAQRYRPDAILAGSIFRAGDELWAGRWTLLRDGARHRWEVSGPTAEAVTAAVADTLAEHYAQEFAVSASFSSAGGIKMEVTGVGSLDAYATVHSYLAGLSVVKELQLVAIDGETLRLVAELNGTSRALEQTIALGRLLEPVAEEREVIVPLGEMTDIHFVPEPVLRYRYRR